MKYFKPNLTQIELKKEYKKLSLILHPDRGGDEEEFKAMANEYQSLTTKSTQTTYRDDIIYDRNEMNKIFAQFVKKYFTEKEIEELFNF